jgi:hypothetical protein
MLKGEKMGTMTAKMENQKESTAIVLSPTQRGGDMRNNLGEAML